jgi:putative effector of murein hydrolase
MTEALTDNIFFGILITLAAYMLAKLLYRKTGSPLLNPFLISFLSLCILIMGAGIPLENYMRGASVLEYGLPVTVLLLAVPLYRQRAALKAHKLAFLAGITAGVLTCMISTVGLCYLFGLDEILLRSLLPRSITTPLGLLATEELGGVAGITMVAIIVNGVSGVLIYAPVYALFRIRHPVAKGIAMGTTSHAIGTAKALELSEVIGAMSGLAIVLTGLITIACVPILNLLLF